MSRLVTGRVFKKFNLEYFSMALDLVIRNFRRMNLEYMYIEIFETHFLNCTNITTGILSTVEYLVKH